MQLVIEHLQKELERQNLLIATNEEMREEIDKHPLSSWPRGPMPEEVYPNMEQFRDELEQAISILKTKSNSLKCPHCNNQPSEEYHLCPYKEDIHNDSESKCNCCSGCTHECAMDI